RLSWSRTCALTGRSADVVRRFGAERMAAAADGDGNARVHQAGAEHPFGNDFDAGGGAGAAAGLLDGYVTRVDGQRGAAEHAGFDGSTGAGPQPGVGAPAGAEDDAARGQHSGIVDEPRADVEQFFGLVVKFL